MINNYTHIAFENEQGLPKVGEVVLESCGTGDLPLVEIVDMSRLHTVQFQANYVYLVCKPRPDLDAWDMSEEAYKKLKSVRLLSDDEDETA